MWRFVLLWALVTVAAENVRAQTASVAPVIKTRIQDEGTSLPVRSKLNFTGAGVSCTDSAANDRTNCDIPGGSGSANVVSATVDFGTSGSDIASVAVTGQTWVTGTSIIVCVVTQFSTTDRADGAEDAVIEGITCTVATRVVSTGFTINAAPALGKAIGKYVVNCTGA